MLKSRARFLTDSSLPFFSHQSILHSCYREKYLDGKISKSDLDFKVWRIKVRPMFFLYEQCIAFSENGLRNLRISSTKIDQLTIYHLVARNPFQLFEKIEFPFKMSSHARHHFKRHKSNTLNHRRVIINRSISSWSSNRRSDRTLVGEEVAKNGRVCIHESLYATFQSGGVVAVGYHRDIA